MSSQSGFDITGNVINEQVNPEQNKQIYGFNQTVLSEDRLYQSAIAVNNNETITSLSAYGELPFSDEFDFDINQTLPFKQLGYIIEFKTESVAIKRVELNQKAEKNNNSIFKPVLLFASWILPAKYEPTLPSNLDKKTELHKKNVLKDKERFREDISNLGLNKITGRAISSGDAEKGMGETLGEYSAVFNGIAMDLPAEEINEIRKLDYVKEVYPNMEVRILLTESVPLIRADKVWELDKDVNNCIPHGTECLTGKDVKIAIIDTGVDYTHPDLGGCFGKGCKVIDGYDFVNKDNDPMDDHGHGTHVAATAAGNGVLRGVAPDAKIYAYKVLSAHGSGTFSDIISAIESSVDPNNDSNFDDRVDIISMSLGGPGNPDDAISKAVDNAVEAGVIAVIAAGNSGHQDKTINSPGTARKAITVGATFDRTYNNYFFSSGCFYPRNPTENNVACFSSRGPVAWKGGTLIKPDVVAPGVEICAAQWDTAFGIDDKYNNPYRPDIHRCIDNKHIALSGTSMATPIVAGASALLKQAHPEWSPEEIKQSLRNTAEDLGIRTSEQGHGRIDVLKAIKLHKPTISKISSGGSFSGNAISIRGTVESENLINYTLYYKSYSNYKESGEWIKICSSSQEVADDVLCDFNIGKLDGNYLLKLAVKSIDQESKDFAVIDVRNNYISYPENLVSNDDNPGYYGKKDVISTTKGNLPILGNSYLSDFGFYKIKLCGHDIDSSALEGDCVPDGIELENGGLLPVINGTLGAIDLTKINKSGFYKLKLLTYDANNFSVEASHIIYIESDFQKGWPVYINFSYFSGFYSFLLDQPVIADIDNDNLSDIILAQGNTIWVYKHDGTYAEGWPKHIQKSFDDIPCFFVSGPSIGDVNGDGYNEIVAGDYCGFIHVLDYKGDYLPMWPKQILNSEICPSRPYSYPIVINTPALADINNDKALDILAYGECDDSMGGEYLP